jgi:hypothetical protein
VNWFLRKLNTEYSKLNDGLEKLADLLVSLDLVDSPFATYPPYDFGMMKKGTSCGTCHRLSTFVRGNKLVCGDCGAVEHIDTAVVRNVQELKMLFPEMRITTALVREWCGIIDSKKMLARILKENFKVKGSCKSTFYE